jgi:hypothetical protein
MIRILIQAHWGDTECQVAVHSITVCLKAIILIVLYVIRFLTLASFVRTQLLNIRCQFVRAFRSPDFQLKIRLLLFWEYGAEFDFCRIQCTLITLCLYLCLY